MKAKVKNGLWILLALFLIVWIFKEPRSAADLVANIWGILVDGFNALLEFFSRLLSKT